MSGNFTTQVELSSSILKIDGMSIDSHNYNYNYDYNKYTYTQMNSVKLQSVSKQAETQNIGKNSTNTFFDTVSSYLYQETAVDGFDFCSDLTLPHAGHGVIIYRPYDSSLYTLGITLYNGTHAIYYYNWFRYRLANNTCLTTNDESSNDEGWVSN